MGRRMFGYNRLVCTGVLGIRAVGMLVGSLQKPDYPTSFIKDQIANNSSIKKQIINNCFIKKQFTNNYSIKNQTSKQLFC